jgi:hypothetical protein
MSCSCMQVLVGRQARAWSGLAGLAPTVPVRPQPLQLGDASFFFVVFLLVYELEFSTVLSGVDR